MAVTFIDLPDEIILGILASTDWKTILRCSAVSRTLYSLISDSILLQYLIELGSALLIDDCLTTHSIPEKLSRLRDRQSRWKTLNFAKRETFRLGEANSIYELQHGYWIQCDPREPGVPVYIQQFPSPVTLETPGGNQEAVSPLRSLWHENHGFVMVDLSIDPPQNLCVYLCANHAGPSDVYVHIRAIADNLPHPLAASTILDLGIPEEGGTASYSQIQILGDLIGIFLQFLGDTDESRVEVFDWKCGTKLTVMVLPGAESFTFLSETLFLVFTIDGNESSLNIYPVVGSRSTTAPTASFLLPKPKDSVSTVPSALRCEPSPLPELSAASSPNARIGHSLVDRRFFRTSPEARVISLSLIFNGSDGQRHFSLIISAKLLLDEIYKRRSMQEEPTVIPWSDWGMRSARMLPGRSPQIWVSFNWGSRLILDHQDGEIEVLDFNPYTVRRAREDGDTKTVTQTTSIEDNSVFLDEEIVTSLPYTVSVLNLEYSYEGVMIDEERIIVVKREEKKLEVFAM